MTNITRPASLSCPECGFTTRDVHLFNHHSCDIEQQGGFCEDYPACGHEAGDCNGKKYGSDEAIKARVLQDIIDGHGDCDHEEGIYNCRDTYDLYNDDEEPIDDGR